MIFFFQAEDGIRDIGVTGVQTCALPILAIAIGVSFWGSHFVLAAVHTDSLTILLALAACLFFLTNTGLVSTVISLVEEKPFRKVWQQCHAWAFPYYLVGAALAGLVVASGRSAGWK